MWIYEYQLWLSSVDYHEQLSANAYVRAFVVFLDGCFASGCHCTLGSRGDEDEESAGEAYGHIWLRAWTHCARLRLQMHPQLCYRQEAWGSPVPSALLGPGTVPWADDLNEKTSWSSVLVMKIFAIYKQKQLTVLCIIKFKACPKKWRFLFCPFYFWFIIKFLILKHIIQQ